MSENTPRCNILRLQLANVYVHGISLCPFPDCRRHLLNVFYMHCMSAYHPVISDNHSTCNANVYVWLENIVHHMILYMCKSRFLFMPALSLGWGGGGGVGPYACACACAVCMCVACEGLCIPETKTCMLFKFLYMYIYIKLMS